MTDPVNDSGSKRTSIYPLYADLGARIVDFGGWDMPVQFSGITAEHHAVRSRAGLFDVSHMGEIEVSGPDALDLMQILMTNDIGRARVGQAVYSPMCREDGGIIDDLLIYRLESDRFLLVVNAGNTAKDFAHIKAVAEQGGWPGVDTGGRQGPYDARVVDRTADYSVLALQGPGAAAVLASAVDDGSPDPTELKPFRFYDGVSVAGISCLVSRTGYTGEDGFELYCGWDDGPRLWEALLGASAPPAAPAPSGGTGAGTGEGDAGPAVMPCGLGARDTLRFEACLALYGNELDEETNPLEARLGFFINWDKGDFIGRRALARIKEEGPARRLVGLELEERGIPRQGYAVTDESGRAVGAVTSGTMSPTLGRSLALAYVPPGLASAGTELSVDIRGRHRACRVVKTPFYRRGK